MDANENEVEHVAPKPMYAGKHDETEWDDGLGTVSDVDLVPSIYDEYEVDVDAEEKGRWMGEDGEFGHKDSQF